MSTKDSLFPNQTLITTYTPLSGGGSDPPAAAFPLRVRISRVHNRVTAYFYATTAVAITNLVCSEWWYLDVIPADWVPIHTASNVTYLSIAGVGSCAIVVRVLTGDRNMYCELFGASGAGTTDLLGQNVVLPAGAAAQDALFGETSLSWDIAM